MTTSNGFDYSKYENVNVCFHIGRGGRFHNHGHKSYNSNITSLQQLMNDGFILNQDEDGNELPDDEWKFIDSGDNVILEGRDEIESETGILDWDGEYDTDIVRNIADCTEEEYQIIVDAANNNEWVNDDVLAYACQELDLKMVNSIKVYPFNMEVFTQDGCVSLSRDGFEAYTEDEEDDVREVLADMGFIKEAVEKIIDKMETYEWFSEE